MAGSEAQLMRDCAPLYAAWAFESFGAMCCFVVFCYLLLLITNKGRVHSPGKAMWRLLSKSVTAYLKEVWENAKQWHTLQDKPMLERFAWCAKTNQFVCVIQIVVAFLTVTRWLHVGNVNGFRYLGYAVTCPPMQAQLVIMIGPVVPCYKATVVITYVITFMMLITGYGASLIPGGFADGDWDTFMSSGKFDDLRVTTKFWWLFPSMAAIVWLVFIQMPYLLVLYWSKGGVKSGLPIFYPKLIIIVAITWLTFPLWWLISFEGLSLIEDTKLNGIGFACLNVISKASFCLHVLKMVAWHRKQKRIAEKKAQAAAAIANGETGKARASMSSVETEGVGLFEAADAGEGEADQPLAPRTGGRAASRRETWMVSILRAHDVGTGAGDLWSDLEGPYQGFLMGAGYEPKTFNKLSVDQKTELQERYELLSYRLPGATKPKEKASKDVEPMIIGKS